LKKISGAILVAIIVSITSCYVLYNIYQLLSNKNESKETLERAYELISEEDEGYKNNEQSKNSDELIDTCEEKSQVILEDDIIGVLIIPKLNVTAPVKDGTSQEVMKTSVGHFVESDYWNGNVSFASHNGGTNAHYFEKINLLKENDEIEYLTKLGSKKYMVSKVFKIESTDWSEVYKNSEENEKNTITLITCINGFPNYRLCVKGIEI